MDTVDRRVLMQTCISDCINGIFRRLVYQTALMVFSRDPYYLPIEYPSKISNLTFDWPTILYPLSFLSSQPPMLSREEELRGGSVWEL
jgi:hypothetical protein